jgi:uncharacterized protein (TIGR04255 family)
MDGAFSDARQGTATGTEGSRRGLLLTPMPRPRPLRNAPLVEALLDIRVEPAAGLDLSTLEKAADALGARYKRKGVRRHAGIEVHVDQSQEAATAKVGTTREGFVMHDESGKRVVQILLGGFTQNVLKPYSNFENLVDEARRNWATYVDVARPQRIIRTALRYINDLRIPAAPEVRFEDYLPFVPKIPEGVAQTTSDFATRMTIHDDRIDAKVVVAQLFQGTVDEDGVQVILDIDAISEMEMSVDDSALWTNFDKLRKLKNDVFFSYTTDLLLERYQ